MNELIQWLKEKLSPEDKATAVAAFGEIPADPETVRLRAEVADLKRLISETPKGTGDPVASDVACSARYAEGKDAKITPAERADVETMYRAALSVDGGGVATFSAAGQPVEGEAVAALRKLLDAKPALGLKDEKLPAGSAVFSAGGGDDKAPTIDTAAIFAERAKAVKG